MPIGPNLIFDKYELVRRLAIGGMGEVFIARQVSDISGFERHVILKSPLPDLAQEPGFVEQFLDEARVAATLNHPNVVSVFEVGLSSGTYYLAMEFIPGVNLSQLRRQSDAAGKPLSPHLLARIIAEAAAGLHHAHSATDVSGRPLQLVHRDISPHNLMVRADGLTKVVDFGIASAANRVTRTRTGVVKGKLAYMSPEQLRSLPLDGRSDQFSLGIVFWELLSGRRLFHADNDLGIAQGVLHAAIAPPSAFGAPASLDPIVMRMLEREPTARFDSCADLSRALEAWLRSEPVPGDHTAVAAHLREVAGRDMGDQSLITPDDFVLKLRSDAPPPQEPRLPTIELPSSAFQTVTNERPRRRRLSLAVAAIAGVLVAGVAVQWSTSPSVSPVELAPLVTAPVDAGSPATNPEVAPPVVAMAELSARSAPPGARLRIDGRLVGETPLRVPVSSGEVHQLTFELDGHKTVERTVAAVDAGALADVEVALTRLQRKTTAPAPSIEPATGPALLSVRTDPVSYISLDGREFPIGMLFRHPTVSGQHTLEFRLASGARATAVGERSPMKIVLRPNETGKYDLKLQP